MPKPEIIKVRYFPINFTSSKARQKGVETAVDAWKSKWRLYDAKVVDETADEEDAWIRIQQILFHLLEDFVCGSSPVGRKFCFRLFTDPTPVAGVILDEFNPIVKECQDYQATFLIEDEEDGRRICLIIQTYFHKALEDDERLKAVEKNVTESMMAIADDVQGFALTAFCLIGTSLAVYELDVKKKEICVVVENAKGESREKITPGQVPNREHWSVKLMSEAGKVIVLGSIDRQLFRPKSPREPAESINIAATPTKMKIDRKKRSSSTPPDGKKKRKSDLQLSPEADAVVDPLIDQRLSMFEQIRLLQTASA